VTWLRQRAHQASEGQPLVEPTLGHLGSRERIGGYAAAVFETLSTEDLEEVEDELFRFARTVEATPALRRALVDSGLPADVRGAVVQDLLADRGHPATLRLVEYAITGGRARDLVGTLNWLVERTAEARGWRVARVSAAAEVGEEDRRRLVESLTQLSGQPVDLQVTIDPALLAGVVVNIGDLRVDATARGRIDELREHVGTGAWWNPSALGSRPRQETGTGTESEGPEGAD
jgi:F-type H+-transporting ATPase subunit delta